MKEVIFEYLYASKNLEIIVLKLKKGVLSQAAKVEEVKFLPFSEANQLILFHRIF